MRFLHIVLLSGCFSLCVAQAKKPDSPAHQPAAKKVAAPVEKIMEGMLVSVDQTKQSFIIKLRGMEYPFLANNTTDVTATGGKKGFANLSAGMGAKVTYTRDNKGNRVALSISQDYRGGTKPAPAAKRPVKAAQPAAAAVVKTAPAARPASAAKSAAPATAAKPAAPATAAKSAAPASAAKSAAPASAAKSAAPATAAKPATPATAAKSAAPATAAKSVAPASAAKPATPATAAAKPAAQPAATAKPAIAKPAAPATAQPLPPVQQAPAAVKPATRPAAPAAAKPAPAEPAKK
ncbi:MAG: hypothetical protein JW913_08515 [Chitinispirillaceae bacterium]|nr:hypothetical protein [Chitinispirillaceae bacterium]